MSIMHLRSLAQLVVLASGLLLTGQTASTKSAPPVTVREGHPRIWLTPTVLAALRAKAAANSPRWQALKRQCDRSGPPDWSVGIMDYALVYQVTGDPTYADKAITLMQLSVNDGLTAITPDSGYQARNLLPGMAVGYDWCYNRLTPAQRAQFQTQMEQWADWVWPETNPSRSTAWAIDNPGNNYYQGFMYTWIIGLALAGESSKAAGYIDLAMQKWNTAVVPYLATLGAGGYLLEGTAYGTGSTRDIFWYLAAHASATGQDLLNAPGFSWAKEAIISKLYLTTPMRDRLYPGGDQARDSSAPLSDYDRTAMLIATSFMDPTTGGYAKWWLDHINPNQDQWGFTQWEEFLWYNDDLPAVDYTQALKPGYWSRGAGWMTSRSGWDTDATQVAMMVGPTLESHQDRAQNGFMIFRGEWLAASAKLTSHSGLIQESSANNSLTVGGHEQFYGEDTAKVLHYEDQPQYAYFSGEASPAYQKDGVSYLNGFRRELLYLKPGRVLIFDHVVPTDPSMEIKWHLNTLNEPTVSGHNYQTTIAGSTLFGRTLLPLTARSDKQPLLNGTDGKLSDWRIDVAAPTGQSEQNFLNALEIGPASQTAMSTLLPVTTMRPTLTGTQIGNQLVLFDTAPSWSIMYGLNSTPALEQYILDQTPGKWYRVTVQSGRGIPLQQLRVQASDQGVLAFNVTAVSGRTVLIYPEATVAKAKRKTKPEVKTAHKPHKVSCIRISRKG